MINRVHAIVAFSHPLFLLNMIDHYYAQVDMWLAIIDVAALQRSTTSNTAPAQTLSLRRPGPKEKIVFLDPPQLKGLLSAMVPRHHQRVSKDAKGCSTRCGSVYTPITKIQEQKHQ